MSYPEGEMKPEGEKDGYGEDMSGDMSGDDMPKPPMSCGKPVCGDKPEGEMEGSAEGEKDGYGEGEKDGYGEGEKDGYGEKEGMGEKKDKTPKKSKRAYWTYWDNTGDFDFVDCIHMCTAKKAIGESCDMAGDDMS